MLFQIGSLIQKPSHFGMRSHVVHLFLASACAFVAPTVFAAAQAKPSLTQSNFVALSLQDILNKVEQYQASQGVWQAQQQVVAANIKQSQLRTNPNLVVQQTGFGTGQARELEVGVSQKLDVFGVRKTAQQLVALQADQFDLNRQLYQAQLQLVVKAQWAQLLLLQLEQQSVQAQLETSQATVAATRLRYQAGSISQVDLDRALMVHIEQQRQAQQVQLNLNIAKQQFAHLWGEQRSDYQLNPNMVFEVFEQTPAAVARDQAQNLYQKSLALQSTQQQAELAHLKAQAKPAPTLLVGMLRSQEADTTRAENRVRVGVEIPLTIFDRQQYAQQALQAKQNFVAKKQQFYQKHQQQSIQTALAELAGLKQQFELMHQQQLPLSEVVQRKTLLGFQAGKYAISDVQQATLQLQQQRVEKVQLLKAAWQKAIEVESLALGLDPNVVQAKDALWQINQNVWQETNAMPVVGATQ